MCVCVCFEDTVHRLDNSQEFYQAWVVVNYKQQFQAYESGAKLDITV